MVAPNAQSTPTMGNKITLPLNSIRPYWRNPRRVPDEAVNALAHSIAEFGYQQPIVVDDEYVIIIGHTRYTAMRRLGITSAEVLVVDLPPEKVKQLRVIDNRAGEFSTWDFDALAEEIESIDSQLLRALFPESGDEQDQDNAEKDLPGGEGDTGSEAEFVCPHCFHSWEAKVTKQAVIEGRIAASAATTAQKVG